MWANLGLAFLIIVALIAYGKWREHCSKKSQATKLNVQFKQDDKDK
jgi:hypothetical protein